jgi:hypothetical protein
LLELPHDLGRARTAAGLIEQGYKTFGFLDVRVSVKLIREKKGDPPRLVFRITEGPRYKVAEARITGVGAEQLRKLLKGLQLHAGDDCSLATIRQDKEYIQQALAAMQTMADVREQTSSPAPGKVVVVYQVSYDGHRGDSDVKWESPQVRQWLFHFQVRGDAWRKAEETERLIQDPSEWNAWGGQVRRDAPEFEKLARGFLDNLLEGAIQETLEDQIGQGPDTWAVLNRALQQVVEAESTGPGYCQ